MKILSINVGRPKNISFHGKDIWTAIQKTPVDGPLALESMNFEGDEQADLTVHGGRDKAVYVMSAETYQWWKAPETEGGGHDVPYGTLGENLTVEGLREDSVFIGDVFELGSAKIQITQPRLPCGKLNAVLQDSQGMKKMFKSQLPGVYFRVLKAGQVRKGDWLKRLESESQQPEKISVLTLFNHLMKKDYTLDDARRYLTIPDLNPRLKQKFQETVEA